MINEWDGFEFRFEFGQERGVLVQFYIVKLIIIIIIIMMIMIKIMIAIKRSSLSN